MYARCEDPNSHWALCTGTAWGKDYPDGFTFALAAVLAERHRSRVVLQRHHGRASPHRCSPSGATRPWTFRARETQIDKCIPLTGDARVQCWADLDKYLMEDVVSWVPYLFDNDVVVLSANVTNYSFDQFAGLPALDHLAVESGTDVARGVAPLRGATPRHHRPRRKSQALGKEPKGMARARGVGIGGRGRRFSRYPPAGTFSSSCGDRRGPGIRRPRATPLSAGPRAFRPVLQAHPLVRLMHQTVGDRAEAEGFLLPVPTSPVRRGTEAGVLAERRREMAERVEAHPVTDLGDRQLRIAQEDPSRARSASPIRYR